MEESKNTNKEQTLSWYQSKVSDEETMKLIREDVEAGFGKDQIDSYLKDSFSLELKKKISRAIHTGLGKNIFSRLTNLNNDQVGEALNAFTSGVPQEVIYDMIQRHYSAHHMKKALEEYKADLAGYARERMLSDKKKTKEKVQEETKNEEMPIPEETNEEALPEEAEQTEVNVSQNDPDPQGSVSSGADTDILEKCVDVLSNTVRETMSYMADTNSKMLKEVFDGVREHDEWLMKKMAKEVEPDKPVIKPEPVQVEPEPVEEKPVKKQSLIRETKKEDIEPIFKDEEKKKKQHAAYDGYSRMVMLPNGAIYPIFIERTEPAKPAGIVKRAAGLFKKETPAKALINQLIDEKLDKEQLQQILRAVRLHFSKTEIKDLIESDLPADEMQNIIDVVLADKGQVAGVM